MANGDPETGVCAMKLDEGLDTGPVYACEKTPIDPGESVQQLSERLSVLGCGLIRRSLEGIVDGILAPVPQDSSRATLARILTKQDGNIDWNLPARTIYNRIRAFQPWPGARTLFRDAICRILKARVHEGETSAGRPGTVIVGAGASRFLAVMCGNGTLLELLEVQLPNRKPQTGLDLVNGFRITTGEILHYAE
jgi:methionyl-tRNA formyltransferase